MAPASSTLASAGISLTSIPSLFSTPHNVIFGALLIQQVFIEHFPGLDHIVILPTCLVSLAKSYLSLYLT